MAQWCASDWPDGSAWQWLLPAQVDDMEDMMRGVVHVLDDDGVFVCQAYAAPLNAMAPKRRI